MKSVTVGLVAVIVLTVVAGILATSFGEGSAEYYSGNNNSVRLDH